MIFNKDSIYLFEQHQINLSEQVLIKIEDGLRKDRDMLLTIDASHYAYRNGNGCIYRHDTVRNDIHTYVYPTPKPIIEKHNIKKSQQYGSVIAADYMLTDYYKELEEKYDLEGLSTSEYLQLCKDHILPMQKRDGQYNGLAFVQVTGKLDNKVGIKKVLDREFVTVSIGAAPKRLICSDCLQDQVQGICDHYTRRYNDTFMLAESLEYEELSFVNKPADKFGRIVRIHDGEMEESTVELEDVTLDASVNVVDIQDFFQEAEGKKIVCVDNICAIINNTEEDVMAKKKEEKAKVEATVLSLADEFSAEALRESLKSIELKDEEQKDIAEALTLTDEQKGEIGPRTFAIVQKTTEGDKRRFPLHDELHVRAGLALIDEADDLTEAEKKKAMLKLEKAAAKFGIELQDEEPAQEEPAKEEPEGSDGTEGDAKLEDDNKGEEGGEEPAGEGSQEEPEGSEEPERVDTLLDELKELLSSEEEVAKLEDYTSEEANPKKDAVTKIFDLLKWYAVDQAVAAKNLGASVSSFLEDQGKKAIAQSDAQEMEDKAAKVDGLTDELKESNEKVEGLETEVATLKDEKEAISQELEELKVEVEFLEDSNKDLNFELRVHLVDELVASKVACGTLEDEAVDAEKENLMKISYDALDAQVKEYRKLTAKLKDSVNNNLDINTVEDPTLQDSESPEDDATPNKLEDDDKATSEQEMVSAFVKLFTGRI